MISNSLKDTRLEFTQGSAILDTLNAASSDAILVKYEGSEVRFPKPGIYRLDSDVGELQVYSGECKVLSHNVSTLVDSTHLYYFALQMTTQKFGDGATDEFYDWASNRNSIMADQNQLASAEKDDPLDGDPGGLGGAGLGSPYVVPPAYLSPNYSVSGTPLLGYSTFAGVNNPFYVYQPSPFSSFVPGVGLVLFSSYRNRPAGTYWPVAGHPGYHPIGGAYHPPIGITRWPTLSSSGLTHLPIVGSGYRPPAVRPSITSGARPAGSYSAPHVGAVHVGHR